MRGPLSPRRRRNGIRRDEGLFRRAPPVPAAEDRRLRVQKHARTKNPSPFWRGAGVRLAVNPRVTSFGAIESAATKAISVKQREDRRLKTAVYACRNTRNREPLSVLERGRGEVGSQSARYRLRRNGVRCYECRNTRNRETLSALERGRGEVGSQCARYGLRRNGISAARKPRSVAQREDRLRVQKHARTKNPSPFWRGAGVRLAVNPPLRSCGKSARWDERRVDPPSEASLLQSEGRLLHWPRVPGVCGQTNARRAASIHRCAEMAQPYDDLRVKQNRGCDMNRIPGRGRSLAPPRTRLRPQRIICATLPSSK